MAGRKLVLTLLVSMLLAVHPAAVSAHAEQPAGVVVSPARIAAVVKPGDQLPPIRVINGGTAPFGDFGVCWQGRASVGWISTSTSIRRQKGVGSKLPEVG